VKEELKHAFAEKLLAAARLLLDRQGILPLELLAASQAILAADAIFKAPAPPIDGANATGAPIKVPSRPINLSTPLDYLSWPPVTGTSMRTQNVLYQNGVVLIGELVQFSDQRLLQMRNFGRKSFKYITGFLDGFGLHTGMILEAAELEMLQAARLEWKANHENEHTPAWARLSPRLMVGRP